MPGTAPTPVSGRLMDGVSSRRFAANGIEINVAVAGTRPAVLLPHGFPHSWWLWTEVIAGLAGRHRVIAPRPTGARRHHESGGRLRRRYARRRRRRTPHRARESSAAVVGIDAGTPPAFLFAMRNPARLRRLVLVESVLGPEDFLAGGAPWWFGFHSVPGLAETVPTGHEAEYVDWSLAGGTRGRGVPREIRGACTGREALRSHYRAAPISGRRTREAVARGRLTVPR